MTIPRFSPLIGLLLLAPVAQAGGTVYADANLASGLNNGSSWANAFQGSDGLRQAIAASSSGDEVFAAQGTYEPTTSAVRTLSFSLKNGVTIYGGFLGGEASVLERPAIGTAPSIMSGDLSGNDGSNLFNDNSIHVINAAGTNATAIIDGFTVRGGNANSGGSNNDRGGGILCVGSSPTVRNCSFENNRCTFGGGAGYINGSAPSFTDCQFIDCIGGSFGGAFDIAGGGAVRYDRCWFEGCSAQRAGALEVFSSNGVVISNSVFVDNTATGSSGGGGLWFGSGGSAQVRNCVVVGNTATAQQQGGLRDQGSNVSVANCVFWDNAGIGGAQNSANQIGGTTASYCIVEGGLAGVGNSGANPMFVDLAGGDFHLQPGSPCIEAGNSTLIGTGITLDYDLNPRVADDPLIPNLGVGGLEIGIYELPVVNQIAFCGGDGFIQPCPCGNFAGVVEGCANSTGVGAKLIAAGSASVLADDVTLLGSDLAAGEPGLMFAGSNQVNTGFGLPFGDGLRCVGGTVVRFGIQFADGSGNSTFGPGLLAGSGYMPGDTRHFQLWFRDPAGPCGSSFNLSNGLTITFE
jgi:hypothetical protein